MKKHMFLFLMLFLFFTSLGQCNPSSMSALDQMINEAAFQPVEYFVSIDTKTIGDVYKIGLTKEYLTSYLRLAVKREIPTMKYQPDLMDFEKWETDARKWGDISVTVWTVGSDYPIAYHVSIEAGNWNSFAVHKNAYLGYGSKATVPDIIKKDINELVQQFAIVFYKARKEI